ncbi:MAG TPA: heme biosynthesis protein HemY, partial [Marinobacter sp.]|nr:heme biosynthesis protein HemY [Marinobacter sp.]
MIRLLLILLLALLIGAGLALGLEYDLGYIRVSLGNYLVETNFWVGLGLFILLVALSIFLIGAARRLFQGGGMVSGWLARGFPRRAPRRPPPGPAGR